MSFPSLTIDTSGPVGSHCPSAVIKLGGSLLDVTDLAARLASIRFSWGDRPLFVVGGGAAADLVRVWDRRHQLGEERAHWLALDSLELTARLLESLVPAMQVSAFAEIPGVWRQGGLPIVRPREWFDLATSGGFASPPHTWETTTDTIAAWIASLSGADSLWLLKSIASPGSLSAAIQQEAVDRQIVNWVPASLPVHWVNVRDSATSIAGELLSGL